MKKTGLFTFILFWSSQTFAGQTNELFSAITDVIYQTFKADAEIIDCQIIESTRVGHHAIIVEIQCEVEGILKFHSEGKKNYHCQITAEKGLRSESYSAVTKKCK